MSRTASSTSDLRGEVRETCVLVGADLPADESDGVEGPGYSAEESLAELAELAAGAGADVQASTIQTLKKPHPATLIGSGKVEEVKNLAAELDAAFVLFDQALTPSQQRNLERLLERRVLDRTQLILDIFARHARTREGRLQVELAQLSYLLPRLGGRGVQMSRLGGGIGTRGPGETKLETDRRRISQRIDKLEQELDRVRQTRRLQREKRTDVPLSTIALAGYTNAGKSTLFNSLTAANVLADRRMFATLDPTIRVLELPSRRRVLLSDTVGFIRNLPTTLVKAFRATLEEVTEAALILHVVDGCSPHRREQMREVERILGELGAGDKPSILVLNKIDQLDSAAAEAIREAEKSGGRSAVVAVSAKTGQGVAELTAAVEAALPADALARERYRFDYAHGDMLSFLYAHGRVLERTDAEDAVEVTAEAAESVRRRLAPFALRD